MLRRTPNNPLIHCRRLPSFEVRGWRPGAEDLETADSLSDFG